MALSWIDLRNSIKFRLNRDNLPDEFVLEMAQERVDFYGPQLFAPAPTTDYSIITQPGQFFYRLPAGTQEVNYVRVLYNGIWIPVQLADHYEEILANDPLQPPFTTLPVTLAKVYGNQIRLFPTPNGQYPVELTMMATVAAPTDDNDSTNFWCNDGRILLINATCAQICREYLDIAVPNSPRIQTFDQNTQVALNQLMTQSHQYAGKSVMKQWL